MKTQKKKIITPFAIKCPVCNGRGKVKAHLYKDDSFGIDMTYVTCRACYFCSDWSNKTND